VAISDSDSKILWGRAAGVCSNPNCRHDLTVLLANGDGFNIGEMAHVIAHSPSGPRGVDKGGTDDYSNLILLCPTCHRMIDKSPVGTYTIEMLYSWKLEHETQIRQKGKELKFNSLIELKHKVRPYLLENKSLFDYYGPYSVEAANPDSNLWRTWRLRKLDKIIPNNRLIVNIIETNLDLLIGSATSLFTMFKMHANAFEENQYEISDDYPRFPLEFADFINHD
jgi:HNH endonuclease